MATALMGSIAGCADNDLSDARTEAEDRAEDAAGADGGTSTGAGTATDAGGSTGTLTLPESAAARLSLRRVGTEQATMQGGGEDAGVEIVAYRRDSDSGTAVESFARRHAPDSDAFPTTTGASVSLSEFEVENPTLPVEEEVSVDPTDVGVFVPPGARTDEITPDELLVTIPGYAAGFPDSAEEVTVTTENARLVGGERWFSGASWVGGAQWLPGKAWVGGEEWGMDGDTWVDRHGPIKMPDQHGPQRMPDQHGPQRMPDQHGPQRTPDDVQVLASTGGQAPFTDVFGVDVGTPVDPGQTIETANTLFVDTGRAWVDRHGPMKTGKTWVDRHGPMKTGLYDVGVPAPMGGLGAGIALLSAPEGSAFPGGPTEILTSEAGRRALTMAGVTDATGVEWLAGPRRLDATEHFDDGFESIEFLNSEGTPATLGGIVDGEAGPWAVTAHLVVTSDGPTVAAIATDTTPIGSTGPFEEEAFEQVFPRGRLHNSQGFLAVAGGDEIDVGTADGEETTETATEAETVDGGTEETESGEETTESDQ